MPGLNHKVSHVPSSAFPPLHFCSTNPSCDVWHLYKEEKFITVHFVLIFQPPTPACWEVSVVSLGICSPNGERSPVCLHCRFFSLTAWVWEVLKAEWWRGDTMSHRNWLQGHAGSRGFKTLSNKNLFLKEGFKNCWALHLTGAWERAWAIYLPAQFGPKLRTKQTLLSDCANFLAWLEMPSGVLHW